MWDAMDCCGTQLFLVTEVGQIFIFQAFYEEQECKNCASNKPVQDSNGEGRNCIAPALESQRPSAEVHLEQEEMGVTASY